MKNLFFILSGFLFLLFSCKSGNLRHTNNTVYDTPPEIGRLTTDIPKYSINPQTNIESKKSVSDKDKKDEYIADAKKNPSKKEKIASPLKSEKSAQPYPIKSKRKPKVSEKKNIDSINYSDFHIYEKTNHVSSDSINKIKPSNEKEKTKKNNHLSNTSHGDTKEIKKPNQPNKNKEDTKPSSTSSLSEDSLKILAFEKILSKKMTSLTTNNEKFIRAKSTLDKNPKSKLALSTYNLAKKNLENDILDKKVIEDQLFKLRRKRNKVLSVTKNEPIVIPQTEFTPKNIIIAETSSPSDESESYLSEKTIATGGVPIKKSTEIEDTTQNISFSEETITDTPESKPSEIEKEDKDETTSLSGESDPGLSEKTIASEIDPIEKNTEAEDTTPNISFSEETITDTPESKPSEIEKEDEDEDKDETISAIRNLNTSDFSWEVGIKLTQIVDVRSLDEFKQGHIFDAVNMDINSSNFRLQIHSLDKNHPVAVYSQEGIRSLEAAKILEKAGFTIIYNLQPGLIQWLKEKRDIFQ